jgi:hypothetical protein
MRRLGGTEPSAGDANGKKKMVEIESSKEGGTHP